MSPLQIIRFRTLVLQILREMKILILQIRPHRGTEKEIPRARSMDLRNSKIRQKNRIGAEQL